MKRIWLIMVLPILALANPVLAGGASGVGASDPSSALTNMHGHLKEYHAINTIEKENLQKKIDVTKHTELYLYESLYRIKQRNELMMNFKKIESVAKKEVER